MKQIINNNGKLTGIGSKIVCRQLPQVGDTYGGGTIVYISPTYYLIAAQWVSPLTWTTVHYELSTWGCRGSTMGTSTDIGQGMSNTMNIISGCTTSYTLPIAAKVCYDLSLSGYTDWFLPSKDEAIEIRKNRDLFTWSVGSEGTYWTSSEGYGFTLTYMPSSANYVWIYNYNTNSGLALKSGFESSDPPSWTAYGGLIVRPCRYHYL